MLKLYWGRGTCALASHIVLEEVGAQYEHQRIDTRAGEQKTPEYLAINPKGAVPALMTDRGVLTENPVILGYLAQTFPEAKLAPIDDSYAFGDVQAFNMYLASTVHPGFKPFFRPENFTQNEDLKAELKRNVPAILEKAFAYADDRLADGRPWVHGETYTISDPYLLVFERWLDKDGTGGIDRFPSLKAHRARALERDAVKRAIEIEEGGV